MITTSEIHSCANCPQHKLRIRFFNIGENVPSQQRVLCDDCDLTNKIRLTDAYSYFQSYMNDLEILMANIIDEKTHDWMETKKRLLTLRDQMIKHVDELTIKIDYKIQCIQQKIRSNALPNYSDFSSLTLSELQRIAEELSKYQLQKEQIKAQELQEFKINESVALPTRDLAPHRIHLQKLDQFHQQLSDLAIRNSVKYVNFELLHHESQQSSFIDSSFNCLGNIIIGSAGKGIIIRRLFLGKMKTIKVYGLQELVTSLQFSKKNNSFISGGTNQSTKDDPRRTVGNNTFPLTKYKTIVESEQNDDDKAHVIRIWREITTDDWECQTLLVGHLRKINFILFNREENQILSASDDCTIKIWFAENNQWSCKQSLANHKAAVTSLSLNSFNTMLVSSSKDKSLMLWDKQSESSWKHKQKFENAHNSEIYAVSFIYEDRIASGAKEIKIWSADQAGFYICTQIITTDATTKRLFYNQVRQIIVEQNTKPSLNIWMKKHNGDIQIRQRFEGHFTGASISDDGKNLIACKQLDNMIHYYQTK